MKIWDNIEMLDFENCRNEDGSCITRVQIVGSMVDFFEKEFDENGLDIIAEVFIYWKFHAIEERIFKVVYYDKDIEKDERMKKIIVSIENKTRELEDFQDSEIENRNSFRLY